MNSGAQLRPVQHPSLCFVTGAAQILAGREKPAHGLLQGAAEIQAERAGGNQLCSREQPPTSEIRNLPFDESLYDSK